MKNFLVLILAFTFMGCVNSHKTNHESEEAVEASIENKKILPIEIKINKDIPIHSYFKWMDSVVAKHNQTHNYSIDEYLIVHHNHWIIDTLANTDYYYLMDKGIFNEDSQGLIALKKDQVLIIPDSLETLKLKNQLHNTYLELNIPEFRLRIIQDKKEIYKFPVRVGKVGKKYMAMAKGNVDMKTKTGIGEIIRVNKEPNFANPVNNSTYKKTVRDDGKVTSLPAIPWLEPSINGVRVGQLIHPTTNLGTLGKASSNGCIGLRESHAWIVYYYAPLGTKIVSKYELQGIDDEGEPVMFKDIYPGYQNIK